MNIFRKEHIPGLLVAAAVLLLHLFNNAFTTYGYFRDELYYIICTEHLSLGYVDHPPFAVYMLRLIRTLFGDSVFSIRLFPAAAHTAVVILAVQLSRQFGGGSYARILTAICVATAPGLLGMFGIFSVNAFDILLWQIVFLLIHNVIRSDRPQLWIWIGIVIGIGLLSKVSMGWLAAGLFLGMVFTPHRKWFSSPYPWFSAAIALLIFSPYVLWNIGNDFAHLEFAHMASSVKYAALNPFKFLTGMIPHFNPIASPILVIGAVMLFRLKQFRIFGVIIVAVLLILIVNGHSKTEYFNPAAVLLFAAGSVPIEQWIVARKKYWAGWTYLGFISILGIMAIPMALDVLPVETYIRYARALGETPSSNEGKIMGELPQHFADRFGWEVLAENVSGVYNSLNEQERNSALIYGNNYGDVSAVNFFGKKYALPAAVSGHNSYWLWGPEKSDATVFIIIGGTKKDHERVFADVRLSAVHSHPYAMPYETDLPIFICRSIRYPLETVWKDTKHYD